MQNEDSLKHFFQGIHQRRNDVEWGRATSELPIEKLHSLDAAGAPLAGEIGSISEFCAHNAELKKDGEIDLQNRYPRLWEKIRKNTPVDEWEHREKRTIQILSQFELGSRLLNELMIHLTDVKTSGEFGQLIREAREDPEYSAHNRPHVRFIKALLLENIILLTDDLYDDTGVLPVVAAMMPELHDFMQLWLERRTHVEKDFPNIDKVSTKADHCEAGAFFVHVLKPLIHKIGNFSDGVTDQIVATLAAEISVHDAANPAVTIRKLIKDASKPAQEVSDKDLYAAYKHDEINRFTLSGRQWQLILQEKQKEVSRENGYDATFHGAFGLGEEIEKHLYQWVRKASQDTVSLENKQFPEEKVNLIYKWVYDFNFVDTFAMISGRNSLMRKLKVQMYSLERPLAWGEGEAEEVMNSDEKATNKWNKSEWVRQMREYYDFSLMIQESPFSNNTLFNEFAKNSVLINLVQVQEFFEQLMGGPLETTMAVKEILNTRILALAIKALRKGLSERVRKFLEQDDIIVRGRKVQSEVRHSSIPAVASRDLVIREFQVFDPNNEYLGRFLRACNIVARDLKRVSDIMRVKPGFDGKALVEGAGDTYKYSDVMIKTVRANFSTILTHITTILQIDDSTFSQLIDDFVALSPKEFNIKRPIFDLPGPDGLGEEGDARTIHTLPEDVVRRLQAPLPDIPFDEWDSLSFMQDAAAFYLGLLLNG